MDSFMRYINRTARCFTLYRNDQLESEGLNGYQHPYILWVCDHPGISQDELVKAMYVNKSSVTRQLLLLEQNGFVIRKSCPTDRRQLMVYPTEKAYHVYPMVRDVIRKWNEGLMEGLTPQEQELMLPMMQKIMERAIELLEHQKQEDDVT